MMKGPVKGERNSLEERYEGSNAEFRRSGNIYSYLYQLSWLSDVALTLLFSPQDTELKSAYHQYSHLTWVTAPLYP